LDLKRKNIIEKLRYSTFNAGIIEIEMKEVG
jgi:hypothetical protein